MTIQELIDKLESFKNLSNEQTEVIIYTEDKNGKNSEYQDIKSIYFNSSKSYETLGIDTIKATS